MRSTRGIRAAVDGMPVLRFAHQKDWAVWLDKNHALSSGVCLRLAKRLPAYNPYPTPTRSKRLCAMDGRPEAKRRRIVLVAEIHAARCERHLVQDQ